MRSTTHPSSATRAKAALLAGRSAAPDWLAHGGLLVFDDASQLVLDPPAARRVGGPLGA